MDTRRTWLLIAAVLAFGLFVEGLKHWRMTTEHEAARSTGLTLSDIESVRPFHVDSQRPTLLSRARAKIRGMRLSGNLDADATHDFGETHQFAQKAKLTQTESKKKKKKKKRKARGKKDKKTPDIDRPYYPEDDEPTVSDNNNGSQNMTGAFFEPPAQEQKPKDLPVTYDDWAKLILGRPNREEVLRMIEFYRSNLITAEVFYGILEAMLEESNELQHTLSIEAAGSVPSPSSFVFILSSLKSLRNNSEAANIAGQRINDYQSLGNVGHLRPVMENHMTDEEIMPMAMRIFDRSTESHIARANEQPQPPVEQEPLNPSRGDGQQPDGQTPNPNADNERNKTYRLSQIFVAFEPVLTRVLEVHANSEIGQMANRSLERVRSLKTIVVSEVNQ